MKQPLYKRIKDKIKEDIQKERLKPNERLPSENNLAQKYGVSRITSKRALNDLEQEGYIIRKKGVGSFVRDRTKTKQPTNDILFIMPFPDEPSFGNYTQGMLDALKNTKYRLHLQQSHKTNSLNNIHDYCGVIFYPVHNKDMMDFIFPLYAKDIPTIILDKELSGTPFSSVVSNNFQGGYKACQHLIDLGIKNISFISSQDIENVSSIRERYFGYLKALKEDNLTSPLPVVSIGSNKNLTSTINLLKSHHIEGVVSENDIIAIELMNAIKAKGYTIPYDFKIMGFDNTQASQFVDPPLSTIEQNFKEIGKVAMNKLIKKIEQNDTTIERTVIDVSLIERESTKGK